MRLKPGDRLAVVSSSLNRELIRHLQDSNGEFMVVREIPEPPTLPKFEPVYVPVSTQPEDVTGYYARKRRR